MAVKIKTKQVILISIALLVVLYLVLGFTRIKDSHIGLVTPRLFGPSWIVESGTKWIPPLLFRVVEINKESESIESPPDFDTRNKNGRRMEVVYRLTLKVIDPEILLKKTSGDQPLTPIKNILEGEIKRLSPEMCETTGDIHLLADKVSMDIKEALLEYGLEQKELIVKPKEEQSAQQQETPANPNDPYGQMLTPYNIPAHDPVLDLKIGEDLVQKLKEEIGPFDQSKTPNYYNNRGALFAEEGRKEEAIKEFKKVIIMRPQYAVPFINLYNLYRRSERWDEAFFYLEGALKRKYKEGEDFTYVMAMGLIEGNQTDLAIRMFQLGAKYYPDSYRLHVNLGTALASQKKYAEAIESYLKALEIKPDSITAMNNIAYGYYILGNFRLAVKYWEKSLAINPDQPDLKQFILNVQQELKQNQK